MSDEINEKMEQIRIKNEELEKKHQEILKDELEAKKQGATLSKSQAVKTNEKHRYDNVELDYDVKDDQKEHAKNPDYIPKNRRPILGKKQLDEIPPDPVNFLRDDDQNNQADGQAKRPQQQQQQNNRNRNNNNRNPRPRNHEDGGDSSNKERSSNDNQAPRQKNPNHRPRPNPHNNNSNNYQNRSNDGHDHNQAVNNDSNSNSPRKIPPQQLRTERRAAPSHNTSMESSNSEQLSNESKTGSAQRQPHQNHQQNRPKRPNNIDNNRPRPKPNKERIEGKNDITVEVTDEVRSVKLKSSEKTFGTGRVRPSAESYENAEANNDHAQSSDARKQHNKPRNNNTRKLKPKGPPQPEFQHPILDKIVITKTSVQDRLLRSKMMDEKDHQEPKVEAEATEPATN